MSHTRVNVRFWETRFTESLKIAHWPECGSFVSEAHYWFDFFHGTNVLPKMITMTSYSYEWKSFVTSIVEEISGTRTPYLEFYWNYWKVPIDSYRYILTRIRLSRQIPSNGGHSMFDSPFIYSWANLATHWDFEPNQLISTWARQTRVGWG